MIRRRKVDTDIERKLIIGLITSTAFCQEIIPKLKILGMDTFQISFARKVAQWVIDYYEDIGEAPQKHIQDIFNTEKEKLSEEEKELVSDFLDLLSKEYENESQFNVAYLRKKTLEYLKTRTFEIFFERGLSYVEQGKLKHAERLYLDFTKVPEETIETFDPFSEKEVRLYELDGEVNRLVEMPGDLGKVIGGPLERSWLVSLAGPEKRGKSFFLEEFVFQCLFDGLKVFWVSLEMNKYVLKGRIYTRITAAIKEPGNIIIPIPDCKNNQQGICNKKKRINNIKLVDEFGALPEFDPRSKYSPCTVCRTIPRRKGIPPNRTFTPDYWFEEIRVEEITTKIIEKRTKQFRQMFGSNLRCRAYPAFSANFDDIQHELDLLEMEGFVPDIIAIDYFDILAEEKGVRSDRGSIDKTWKRGKNLAAERDCLVITPDQTNKTSRERETIRSTDTTEDKRKDAHVDLKLAINQTMQENDDGVARIGVLFHRHRKTTSKQAMVFQSLELANPFMDSVMLLNPGALKREKMD